MGKLLVICGPTGIGKTALAAKLAKNFDGVLISADSRQVYKGLDIGTGKELPENSKTQKIHNSKLKYYVIEGVKIFGYDLVGPKENFDVNKFIKFARGVLERIWQEGHLPILVGGTGLYIKSIIDGIETSSVPRNDRLRDILEKFSVDELYDKLAQLDPVKAANMNSSDRRNPRRLVRALEIAQAKLLGIGTPPTNRLMKAENVLFVGLSASKKKLKELIQKRVKLRIKMGQEREIRKLLKTDVAWEDQSMSSIGYKEWKDYFCGEKSMDKVTEEWVVNEVNYAKRQMVWFKKDKRINWFDIEASGWQKDVEKLVRKWYSHSNGF
jgi:tRNA dimethylallyltransferase